MSPGRVLRPALCCAALAGVLLLSPAARADIYKFVDARGLVHLSDRPLGPGYKLILRTRPRPGSARGGSAQPGGRARFEALIAETARRYSLNAHLVHAVVRAESAYDPQAESKKGAIGLMQLMPGTARRYGVSDPRDPAQNLAGGVRYLYDLLLQFGDVELALAAYNAGENAVVRHGNRIPPFPETQQYVQRVIGYYRELARR